MVQPPDPVEESTRRSPSPASDLPRSSPVVNRKSPTPIDNKPKILGITEPLPQPNIIIVTSDEVAEEIEQLVCVCLCVLCTISVCLSVCMSVLLGEYVYHKTLYMLSDWTNYKLHLKTILRIRIIFLKVQTNSSAIV